jgi:hypothetical protein
MAWDADDWTITRADGNIRYTGDAHAGTAPTYVTTIQLHRALQDFADNESSTGSDDELSIIDLTPSDRGGADTNITLLNNFNLDATSAEHMYDGSITQDDGDTIYDGIQVFGNATTVQVVQDGALITPDFWNEPKMVTATSDAASGTSHRFVVEVRTGGADIDGRRLLGTQREWKTLYTEFFIGGGTARGNNVLALNANSDLNNQTDEGTIGAIGDVTNLNEGYVGIDADGDTTDENYYSEWDLGAQSKNNSYEYSKYIQRESTAETLYGLNGDVFRGITHAIAITSPAGTFVEPESVTWPTGAGQLLAIDSTTAGTEMWIQLLTGVAPTDAQTITGSGTADVNTTVTPQIVTLPFFGASTGSAIIGAFGLGITEDDLGQNDLLSDLDGGTNQPPNNVTYLLENTIAGDRVLVGPEDGAGGLDLDNRTLQTTLDSSGQTSIVVTVAFDSDMPRPTGFVRVELNDGSYRRVAYTGVSGSTLTTASTDWSSGNAATEPKNVFIAYIDDVAATDSISTTYVYDTDRILFARLRNSTDEIKTFETTATVGSGGGGSVTSRIADS